MLSHEASSEGYSIIDATTDDLDPALPPLLVSVQNAARLLAVGRTTVYELIASGELETIRIGRSRRVPLVALQAFVMRRRG
jgi:excisionase family DNA binding protein